MPDGFNASHVPGVIDGPPPARRDLKDNTATRVAEIVMAPLMVLVGGTMALAAMVLWGVWVAACRWTRPLLYMVAGIALVAVVLLVGGVMGYAYHAYQAANGKLVATAGPSEMPPGRRILLRRRRCPRRGRRLFKRRPQCRKPTRLD